MRRNAQSKSDALTGTFAALADPTRRAILSRLAKGQRTVSELAKPFELSQPAVSKHLKVLERAGLIERGKKAQWRPSTLRAKPLKEAAQWLDGFRKCWEVNFERLDDVLADIQTKHKGATRESKKRN